jgi:two-component system, cell cycle response regulator DivK
MMRAKDHRRRQLVLLVDDYIDAREMYAKYLVFSGFDVVHASTGVEAIDRARERRPDVILMDLSLPVMDGWQATRTLKTDPKTSAIPVLALTSHALGRVAEGASNAGCDGFITKPCLPEDLVSEIRRVLKAPEPTASQPPRRRSRTNAKKAH